ncbi:MAG: hypothetical protein K2J10_07250, partial [Muribaculaceae bacterium]|nr:hypothetical protein [Muribaculaceae bacterium]
MNKTLRNLALVALAAAPFSAFAEIVGDGTATNPYQIATAEDLTNACTKVVDAEANTIYFVQTADIDMAGVKNYLAVNGTYGDYTKAIVYDGRNHVISNFAPDYVEDGGAQGYYNGSIFGVLTGKVKNLGVVNANVDMKGFNKTAGILGAYFGHGSVVNKDFATSVLENVYVTGEIVCGNYNTGGMFGTTGSDVEFINCFANVKFTGTGGKMGGIIGRVNHATLMKDCYVAGTVNAEAALVAGPGNGTLTAEGLVVFNTGSETVCGGTVEGAVTMANTTATEAAGVELVKSWAAFSATEEVEGLPALNYALSGAGTETDPYQ